MSLSFDRRALRRSLQRSFVMGDGRGAMAWVGLLAVALVGGALVAQVHPALAVALPVALAAAGLMLRTPQWGLYATIAVAVGLPFAALPVDVGFKPTFLDLTLGATGFVWFMSLLAGRATRIRFAAMSPLVVAFIVVAFVAFVAGLQHAALDKQTLRRFVEVILAVALFFVVVDHVRRPRQLEGLAAALLWGGFLSAALAIGLYLLPHELANSLLNRLAVFDYPSGWVLRFILDDPANNQRAIGTSVDPNVFGGMMILLTALAAPQVAAPRPLFPRWLAATMAGTMALALFLTFSRGSMVGLVAALAPLMVLRYRRLLPWVALAAVAALFLPQTQDYIGHFIAGLRGEDLATQMRFGEYRDALRLIRRYPGGVGFSAAPDIDLYIGVSNVYLLIAEQMGLLGLAVYLAVVAAFFATAARAIRRLGSMQASRMEPLLLGLTSALVGAMVGGIFDHHFFDIAFPHFVTLFWLIMGLAVAAARLSADPAALTDPAPPAANPVPLLLEGAADAPR